MVGQNRTQEFLEYIRIKTKSTSNGVKPIDTLQDSIIITTGKQMLLSITKMHQRISENQSQYLDLNRFLNPISMDPHHPQSTHNDVWTEDHRFQFENEILIFIKDITAQITNLTQLLDSSELNIDHHYVLHQQNILKCLRFQVSSLSDKIKHLIKARTTALRRKHYDDTLDTNNSAKNDDLERFVDEIMHEDMVENDVNNVECKNKNKNDLSVLKEENTNESVHNMEITQWEMQMFEEENAEMIKLLEEEHKEVAAAEHKTVEIVEMLSMFTEEVMNQESLVTNIEGAISGSLENLEIANKELESAQKRGQDSRTVFMTIVLTLAFSLLFLDWYKS